MIQVVTYNVLSSHLASPSHFTSCNPIYLDRKYRLEQLLLTLDEHTSHLNRAIICLQEISHEWGCELHVYFSRKGYYMITGFYGRKFNGYMGVAIAVPLDKYKLINGDIRNIADTKDKPFERKISWSILSMLLSPFVKLWNYFFMEKATSPSWDGALSRNNQLVSVRLRSLEDESKEFVVGTYHMPCWFDNPKVMMIHTALSVKYLQKRARGDPLIYCGDFNFTPGSSMYRLVTNGRVDEKEPSRPEKHYVGDTWSMDTIPMRSAYRECNQREPDFTNFSKVREEPTFVDTLDYIFLSGQWTVLNVKALPSKEEVMELGTGPFPNKEELSDHMLLAASVILNTE